MNAVLPTGREAHLHRRNSRIIDGMRDASDFCLGWRTKTIDETG